MPIGYTAGILNGTTKDFTEANEKELKWCRESNKWYEDFINSIQ